MKSKFDEGQGGIVGLLIRHCEKIVFGLAVLIFIWVALPSGTYTPVDEDLAPESITTLTNNARTRMGTEESWPLIKEERFPTPQDEPTFYRQRGARGVVNVDPKMYPMHAPVARPDRQPEKKRRDPELYPVEKLEVAVAYGPVLEIDRTPAAVGVRPSSDGLVGRELPERIRARLGARGGVGGVGRDNNFKTKAKYIAAIKGLIPVKRQLEEFELAFAEAAEYDASRDAPNYTGRPHRVAEYGPLYYTVERAEVQPDGTPGEFKAIGSSWLTAYAQMNAPGGAAIGGDGRSGDLADPAYVDPRFTAAVPPLLLRDLEPLALHSQVRSAEAALAAEESAGTAGGLDRPMPPAPGVELDGGLPPVGPSGSEGPVVREGGGRADGLTKEADYKLFRYYDSTVEPGKAYVYRVTLSLEDPNDPLPPAIKPSTRSLHESVIERLARKTDPNMHWRESPKSEISPVAKVPATKQVLLAEVALVKGEKTAKVMVLEWYPEKAMDVPGLEDVMLGSVVNFTSDTEAVDAGLGRLVPLPEFTFHTGHVVLDILGGESIGNGQTRPGEILLFDDRGRLIVQSELEDKSTVLDHTYPPEPVVTAPEGGAGELLPPEGEGPGRRPPRRGVGDAPSILN